jgi:hypothetical protein
MNTAIHDRSSPGNPLLMAISVTEMARCAAIESLPKLKLPGARLSGHYRNRNDQMMR